MWQHYAANNSGALTEFACFDESPWLLAREAQYQDQPAFLTAKQWANHMVYDESSAPVADAMLGAQWPSSLSVTP